MSLNFDAPLILVTVLGNHQPAGDHRHHRRRAAAAIEDLSTSCRRDGGLSQCWAPRMGLAALMRVPGSWEEGMGGAGGRGIDAITGGAGSGVHDTAIPACVPIAACLLFAPRERLRRQMQHFLHVRHVSKRCPLAQDCSHNLI